MYETGAVLAAGGAPERSGQAAIGFAEDDFGESATAVALGQGGGVTSEATARACPVSWRGNLLVVAGSGAVHASTAVTSALGA
ncbi:hypothetical protein ACFTTN_03675 [Streptomyces niveus]|uniref:hypothetical protein n=1 Tax=Streptomyces niveus TaxID=193462 RepID=UPI0036407430